MYGDPPELWSTDRIMATVHHCTAPERYALVERAEQVRSKLASNDDLLSSFDEFIVDSLAYMVRVPIAKQVRAAALDACAAIGPVLTPRILESVRVRPWQAYFNTLYALLLVAPEHARVRELLENAVYDRRRIVRERVTDIISDCDSEWAREVLRQRRAYG